MEEMYRVSFSCEVESEEYRDELMDFFKSFSKVLGSDVPACCSFERVKEEP